MMKKIGYILFGKVLIREQIVSLCSYQTSPSVSL
jgi:hypothetical protein